MRLASLLDKHISVKGYEVIRVPFNCLDYPSVKERAKCVFDFINNIIKEKFSGIVLPEDFNVEILSYLFLLLNPGIPGVKGYSSLIGIPETFRIFIYSKDRLKPLPIETVKELGVGLYRREWSYPVKIDRYYVVYSENTKNIYIFDGANAVDIFGRLMYIGKTGLKEVQWFFAIHPDTGLPAGIQPLWKFSQLLSNPKRVKYHLFPENSGLKFVEVIFQIDKNKLKKKYNAKNVYVIDSKKLSDFFKAYGGMPYSITREVIPGSMKNKKEVLKAYERYYMDRLKITYSLDYNKIKPDPLSMEKLIVWMLEEGKL